MKIKFLVSIVLLFVFHTMQAQDGNVRINRRAIVSVAPLSFAKISGQLKLRAEYAISARKSLTLTVGIPKKVTLPKNFGDYLVTNEQGNAVISDAASNFKLSSILIDYRVYKASKGALRGFYYAPYLNFRKGNMVLVVPNTEFNYEETFSGSGTTFGGGINLGVNWLIKNRVSIDWTFLSLGLQSINTIGSYNTTDSTVDVQRYTDDVERNIAKLPLIGKKFKVAADGDNVSVKLKNLLFPDGAMRLTIGVAF
jgi:hypothetical protein